MTAATVHRHPPAVRRGRLGGMAWVTWRQHRAALFGALAVFGGSGLLLVWQGLAMHRAYVNLGVSTCGSLSAERCAIPVGLFMDRYEGWARLVPRFVEFIPMVIGAFAGAPLVARELESGTFRFAWTQGCTRVRWIVVKLALLGGVLTALAVGFSLLFGWWYGPLLPLTGRITAGQAYEVVGVVFAARTLFGVMLGVLAGAVIRRTVPAVAATAALWLAVAWPSVLYLRPFIQRPVTAPATDSGIGWTISQWIQDAAGHHVSQTRLVHLATSGGQVNSRAGFETWLAQHHYTEWATVEPDSRFWHFQTVEASAYVLLAATLAGTAIWWVRRRGS